MSAPSSTTSSSPQPTVIIDPACRRDPPSVLATITARVRQEGSEILQRLGIRPGPDAALPQNQRFRIDDATTRVWMGRAQLIHRIATAIALGALLAAVLRIVLILSAPTWAMWKVAGIIACIVALVARHAELQLRAQLQQGAAR